MLEWESGGSNKGKQFCRQMLQCSLVQLFHEEQSCVVEFEEENCKIKMAKSPKEKVIHKAMKSADKFYNEIPGNMKLDLIPTLQQHRS